ncbi:MAG: hypothetical protein KGD70_11795 [Candidatus Lokiarchaeota archaeon]|jgi:hypothetical protein|nr:hypothetical protein [Candidatus Lokiarchaeota archaeon]
MEDIKIRGYRIHVMIKVPHLHEKFPTYSYQFLIYDEKGEVKNYPFSRIIAHNDSIFILELKRNFYSYIANNKIKAYPVSNYLENISENSM